MTQAVAVGCDEDPMAIDHLANRFSRKKLRMILLRHNTLSRRRRIVGVGGGGGSTVTAAVALTYSGVVLGFSPTSFDSSATGAAGSGETGFGVFFGDGATAFSFPFPLSWEARVRAVDARQSPGCCVQCAAHR
ncbi:hypothetical protein HYQ46_006829 [Verticillium longisporum]|nr:hypothetical protein HYQ46_006829 [Verticillium longisporum]